MITVGQPSAARLLAEGAYCLDTDTDSVSRHGEVSVLPAPGESSSPILVCGQADDTVRAAAARLEDAGLAAWVVA